LIQRGKQPDGTSGERVSTLTARVIADLVSGELRGDESAEVDGVAPLGRAERRHLSFLADGRYAAALASSSAGILLVTRELADLAGDVPARIVVDKPQAALLELLPRLYPPRQRVPGIDATVRIGRGTKIGSDVTLDSYCVIGEGAVIGDGVWIGSGTVVGDGVVVGEKSSLFPQVAHSGVRIASDGFGYVFDGKSHVKIPHVGRCIIGDDVEIGANTTIDRGSIDDTVIGSGTRIDNLVQVGHNVQVGKLCLIMSQAGISGSARIGDGCVIAGQAGLGGHITIGEGARIAGQSGVFGDVPAGESWSGYPARPHRESLRATAALFKLSGMIKGLEKMLADRGSK